MSTQDNLNESDLPEAEPEGGLSEAQLLELARQHIRAHDMADALEEEGTKVIITPRGVTVITNPKNT